ncbi:LOW QUALITY PROTEIN: serine--tRNA synthetase-like protein Slimp [Culicoides brevitarsis]|uniref:LOW QUALITY PROTEIN: serine--tRNA synthetase-like protein Slimp n=1 Tax=Culicoides brevitarsis TaxID=469753 RepID=UPI00307C825F
MLHFRRNFCTAIKNKLKDDASTKAPHKFISHIPLFDLEKASYQTALRHSLKHRCSKFDFDQIKMQHDLLLDIERIMANLEAAKKEVNKKFNEAETKEILEKCQYEGKLIREDIRSLKEVLVSLREEVNLISQKLPNFLHEKVPLGDEKDIFYEQPGTFMKQGTTETQRNSFPNCTFSTEKDAWLDLILDESCRTFDARKFRSNIKSGLFKEFCDTRRRNFAEENCAVYEEDLHVEDQFLKLVGGGSFASFLPYITKLSLFSSALPLKLVTMGREYGAFDDPQAGRMPSQAQTVSIFEANKTENDSLDRIDALCDIYKNYYSTYGQSFRFNYAPAKDLTPSEALRIDVEVESAYTNEFVTVANIRYFGNYISKRTLFNFRQENSKKIAFPYMIGGTFLHMPKLLSVVNTDTIEIDSYFTQ